MTDEELREERIKLENAITTLMQNPDGEYFLLWLLDEAGVFESRYHTDIHAAQWDEGRRELGLKVFSLCQSAGTAHKLFLRRKENV